MEDELVYGLEVTLVGLENGLINELVDRLKSKRFKRQTNQIGRRTGRWFRRQIGQTRKRTNRQIKDGLVDGLNSRRFKGQTS